MNVKVDLFYFIDLLITKNKIVHKRTGLMRLSFDADFVD